MTLLLDTQVLLWYVLNDSRLSATARSVIGDAANTRRFSIASAWEIAIKVNIGKLALARPVYDFVQDALTRMDASLLLIDLKHVVNAADLPLADHRDPFDRMLVAQSLVEGVALVSTDTAFDER